MHLKSNKSNQIAFEKSNVPVTNYYIEENIKQNYIENGFVVLRNLVSQEILDNLTKIVIPLTKLETASFTYSTMLFSASENLSIHQKAIEWIQPILQRIFYNYKAYSSTFLMKPAYFSTEMDLHQDWSFTDETKYLSTTFWLPLQEVSIENGAIFLIPGSHQLFYNIRSNSLPTARINRNGLLKDYVVSLELKLGDVLLFNPAVFHGSHMNNSSQNRIAYTATILPLEAPLLYFDKLSENVIESLVLDNDAFLTQMQSFDKTQKIVGSHLFKTSYKHSIPKEENLLRLLKDRHETQKFTN